MLRRPDGHGWMLELPGATASYAGDHYIGGPPLLLIENCAERAKIHVSVDG
jgi:hypothetical protein